MKPHCLSRCRTSVPDPRSVRVLPTKTVEALKRGDVLTVQTPGGGGWGAPAERERYRLERDVRAGLISPERAREVYGSGTA